MRLTIGDRITVSKQEKEYIIKIMGQIEPWMNHALLGWVLMWTAIGAYVLYFLFSGKANSDQVFFFYAYIAFWAYFEIKAIHSWLFRSYGFELIKITPNEMYVKRSIFSYGKVKRYVRENIKDLKKVEADRKSINGAFNKSFWVMGNEKIQFHYIGKEVGIGMHLEDKERNELVMQLRKILKRT